MNEEQPQKRKRGRPRKNKTTDNGEKNETEYKGDERTSDRPSDKKRVKKQKRSKSETHKQNNKASNTSSKESGEINEEKKSGKQLKGQDTEFKINEEKNRETGNKDRSENKIDRRTVKRRIRTKDEHNQAMVFLKKRLYFAKNDLDRVKYEYMIKKLDETTEII